MRGSGETVWLCIGFLGQTLFFMRFFVQWLASERERQSVIPISFWYFSLSGGIVLLAYALWREDPIFIIGQATGLFVYCRNLYFVSGRRVRAMSPASPTT
ncbi:lipid-A-disaccharide synthase N-terminal domain-containing protein [uncultured Hyphomicrobium sp.]|uniref:lipid-A-disaccharide synthase N-terminal domain-containing protein n=1 Tax=uncultured Hyphomicrobium sp. TaxID=194373 RepID=UPI002600F09F|nr:lipid-A-disaccharide synthase N-terminal domain-containing protein [uncultured Hyphomicrobium sp.]